MSNLVRWEPFSGMVSLQNAIDRLLENTFVRPSRIVPFGAGLDLDMYETDEDVVIKAALPSVTPEDIEVNVVGDTLTIKGEMHAEKDIGEDKYILRERRVGTFSRSVTLPVSVDTKEMKAEFEKGVLTITAPKAEEVKPKSVQVKVK